MPASSARTRAHAEFFHRAAGLGGLPGFIGGQLALQGRPVGFGQFRAVAQKRLHGRGQERGDGGGVGRIEARLERQRLAGGDLRERERRQFARVNGQFVRGNLECIPPWCD